jgi:Mitochondrial carrier protein
LLADLLTFTNRKIQQSARCIGIKILDTDQLLFPSGITFNTQHYSTKLANKNISMEHLVTFAAGASYGATTVLVGQPLDTLKVRLQSIPAGAEHGSTLDLFRREGIRGLYRGGLPLFVGKPIHVLDMTRFSC